MKHPIPKECDEQVAFADWLNAKGLFFTATAQSTFTGWKQKAKNKRMGVKKGLPDIIIVHDNAILFVEMKRIKGGVASPEQKEWIRRINKVPNCQAIICAGAHEAITLTSKILKLK